MKGVSDCILLALRPEHAAQIYRGEKRAELRKSFPPSTRFVFIYETAPISSITGSFTVKRSIKTSVAEAVAIAANSGVDPNRAANYYGGREHGWVIEIGAAVRFKQSLTLEVLREKSHYFAVPQTFSYLVRSEGLTQEFLHRFRESVENKILLKPLSAVHCTEFVKLVSAEVGSAYEDIDADFIEQILDPAVGNDSAFSTLSKHVLEARLVNDTIGYTVLTEKIYGAWKSGPTILLPEFRGFGLGQALRTAIDKYCLEKKGRGIYCTCSASQPAVVSYLLSSGMELQARLRQHLSRKRDELVFAKKFRSHRQQRRDLVNVSSRRRKGTILRVGSDHEIFAKVLRFFLQQMRNWYFSPSKNLASAIRDSIRSREMGYTEYSAKARGFYAFVSRHSSKRPLAVALITEKRSRMLKINFVTIVRDITVCKRVLRKVMQDPRNIGCRRFYLTVPVCEYAVIHALSSIGFAFEGILNDPFGRGVNHVCFGYLPARNQSVRKTLG